MKIIHAADELKAAGRKVCLAIGFFDGVHLGHQQIIRQTVADARLHDGLALVLTFDRHPNTIVAPGDVPPLIYSLPQKLRAIGSLEPDTVLLLHFDEDFSRQSGEEFVRRLARELGHIQSLCIGADFVFGHKRSGNVSLLKRLGKEMGFAVHGLAAVSLDDRGVSSTRIRELISRGNLDAASQMLGRPYAVCGRVIQGERLGRTFGFPTANLGVAGLVLPPNGVYVALANVRGMTHRAALNIGHRPTVASGPQTVNVEAHLLNFAGDIYGEELELEIGDKLRPEKKFGSRDELRDQIARDVAAVASHFQQATDF